MHWMTLLDELGGAATTRRLRAAGASERALALAMADGLLIRPRRGVYGRPDLSPQALSALRIGGRLSCVSAARSYGLWGGTDGRLHVRLPSHAGRAGGADVRHWETSEPHPELWRVSFEDCLRSAVRCADEETAVAVLDTALSSGRVVPARLTRIFAEEPFRVRTIAARARPGSDSGVESILRQRLQARGHLIEQQIAVPGVGRVDLRVGGFLHVEVDGYAYHSDPAAFERDRLRDTALELQGRRRLRFTARQVLENADAVVATIENIVAVTEETSSGPSPKRR
ncbi:type IV toxin-antitoxin system AbiEi family antitoxin domain-containing protein [Leifsonia aquatica]|jgi:very-short-patch-repair endonuclease|uniref:type IV toxin-antitoxin system AbiEi family antitoxin domain-containing protein n=1 Tax=Leifsonia aquatica TaxID=144185 RepID=UPI003812E6C4